MITDADYITIAATPDQGVAIILHHDETGGKSLSLTTDTARELAADLKAAADRADLPQHPRYFPGPPDLPDWADDHDERP